MSVPKEIWINLNVPWDGTINPVHGTGTLSHFVRADLAQAPAPVRVKALQWDDFRDYGAKAQAWDQANYMIQKWSDGRWEISASYPGYSTFIEGTERFYPTLEAAQAAAQADYEARILAALEPHVNETPKSEHDAGNVLTAPATMAELVEALRLADAALSGANMNMAVVEKKVKAALARVGVPT